MQAAVAMGPVRIGASGTAGELLLFFGGLLVIGIVTMAVIRSLQDPDDSSPALPLGR